MLAEEGDLFVGVVEAFGVGNGLGDLMGLDEVGSGQFGRGQFVKLRQMDILKRGHAELLIYEFSSIELIIILCY